MSDPNTVTPDRLIARRAVLGCLAQGATLAGFGGLLRASPAGAATGEVDRGCRA